MAQLEASWFVIVTKRYQHDQMKEDVNGGASGIHRGEEKFTRGFQE